MCTRTCTINHSSRKCNSENFNDTKWLQNWSYLSYAKEWRKNQLNNYRPITITDPIKYNGITTSIYNQLTVYLEKNNLLWSRQFGFRNCKWTELTATLLFDDVHRAMDRGELTGTIFIDLSKAFDTASHSVLLSKLSAYSLCDREKELFSDYLFNGWQYIQYKSSISTNKPVYTGVPQGSILGPLLFILHFNDAQQQLIRCKIIKCADDTTIYFHDKDIRSIEKVLNIEFSNLSDWLTENKWRLSKVNSNINVEYHFIKVNCTKLYKYLGVKVDPSLNLSGHFQCVYKTTYSRLRFLRGIRPNLTKTPPLRIYQAFIVPKIMYYSFTNYFQQNYRLNLLSSLENRASAIIDTKSRVRVPSINQIHKRKICKFVRKCLDGQAANFVNYFTLIDHSRGTRNNKCSIRLPSIKLESTRNSFFSGAYVYNKLPNELRSEANFNNFITLLNKNEFV